MNYRIEISLVKGLTFAALSLFMISIIVAVLSSHGINIGSIEQSEIGGIEKNTDHKNGKIKAVKIVERAMLFTKEAFYQIDKDTYNCFWYISDKWLRYEDEKYPDVVTIFNKPEFTYKKLYLSEKTYSYFDLSLEYKYQDQFTDIDICSEYKKMKYRQWSVKFFKDYYSINVDGVNGRMINVLYLTDQMEYLDTYDRYDYYLWLLITKGANNRFSGKYVKNRGFPVKRNAYLACAHILNDFYLYMNRYEVIEYKEVELDPSFFEVPAGFKEVPYDPKRETSFLK